MCLHKKNSVLSFVLINADVFVTVALKHHIHTIIGCCVLEAQGHSNSLAMQRDDSRCQRLNPCMDKNYRMRSPKPTETR